MHSPATSILKIDRPASFAWRPDDLSREAYGVCGIPIDAIDMAETLQKIRSAAEDRTQLFISTVNVNYLAASRFDSEFRDSLVLSDLCTADGMPIVWIARFLGIPIKERIPGSDVFEALMSQAISSRRLKVFLFGDADDVAKRACQKINTFGHMTCVGALNPGFCPVEEMSTDAIIDEINSSGADLLVIALGAIKGQAWLKQNNHRLRIPVRVHLGSVIKYQAGTVRRAPVYLRKWGLEWLWRIKEEPHLLKRYWSDGIVLLGFVLSHVMPLYSLMLWGRLLRRDREQDLLIMNDEGTNSVTLNLKGAAIAGHVKKATRSFRDALDSGKSVIINFANTSHIDARFIGLLIILDKQLMRRQRLLTFADVSPRLERIFRLNGLEFLLPR
jgi:N-acetylglucosaminyldiphosphoundecaprenol N-acetyl-beta-D-mannosaminyltransferase